MGRIGLSGRYSPVKRFLVPLFFWVFDRGVKVGCLAMAHYRIQVAVLNLRAVVSEGLHSTRGPPHYQPGGSFVGHSWAVSDEDAQALALANCPSCDNIHLRRPLV